MKFELVIILACSILVAGIIIMISNEPNTIISVSGLEKINQQVLEAKESKDQNRLDVLKPLMQMQLKKITSSELETPIESIYLEEDWNFPFRDSSEIKPHLEEHKTIPICNILPNLPLHLKNIQNTELFSMFSKKYHSHSIELDIADERYYNSTTHYGFTAKSGNNMASTHFHVNSCTGQTSGYYYLMCHNPVIGNSTNSNYESEVVASLQSNEFCVINLEPWRQKLADYNEKISENTRKLLDQLSTKGKSTEEIIKIADELQRMGLLNDMIRFAMMGDSESDKLHEEMEQYEKKFSSVPEEFLELIRK